jgi:hypothetical protein
MLVRPVAQQLITQESCPWFGYDGVKIHFKVRSFGPVMCFTVVVIFTVATTTLVLCNRIAFGESFLMKCNSIIF